MSLGFIMLRHVKCKVTNEYWIESYNCLRKFYPNNHIMIIDDNSNYDFITAIILVNTTIIQSEYKQRGELLPYIYYLRYPIFDKAVIIHDSVFFQQYVDFQHENVPLWYFNRNDILIQNRPKELELLKALNNNEPLLELYNSKLFNGCFGSMSIINFTFLDKINIKYNLGNLIQHITSRDQRMVLERVIGVIFSYENIKNSVFGDIFSYNCGYTYDRYLFDKKSCYMPMIPVIKIWSGR